MTASLPWPLAVLDFEASSLELTGYPIEAGLALWHAPGEPIFGWSVLIRPTDDWRQHGHWSLDSAKVHGLRGRDLIADGWPPQRVARALNEALGPGRTAWCDGGPYDAFWTQTLFRAAGIDASFVLGDWYGLARSLGKAARERAFAWLERVPARHRAREDAESLLLALAQALNVEVATVEHPGATASSQRA
jgi:hypothetical protein